MIMARDFVKDYTWSQEHIVAENLHKEDKRLSVEDYSLLMTAIRTNLPVKITYTSVLREFHETKTITENKVVMVDHMSVGHKKSNYVRLRYWGASHDLSFDRIKRITSISDLEGF